jgi:hypothetical protein
MSGTKKKNPHELQFIGIPETTPIGTVKSRKVYLQYTTFLVKCNVF